MKPDPKKQAEKRLRGLHRELEELDQRLNHPPSVRLAEPIQRGWLRRYVLTKAAALRPDVAVLREILAVIGSIQYHWRRDFHLGRRWSRGKVKIEQPLDCILVDKWRLYPEKYPEHWNGYFHLEYRYDGRLLEIPTGRHQWFRVFTDAHLFGLKVEPFWLTHVKIIDADAMERQAEICECLGRSGGAYKYRRLKGKWARWHPIPSRQYQHEFEKEEKQRLRHFLTTPEEAEARPSLRRLRFSLFPASSNPHKETHEMSNPTPSLLQLSLPHSTVPLPARNPDLRLQASPRAP